MDSVFVALGFLALSIAMMFTAIKYPLLMVVGLMSALLVYLYPVIIASSFLPSVIKVLPFDWKEVTIVILKSAINVTESLIGRLI
jgi:hypothetical protein